MMRHRSTLALLGLAAFLWTGAAAADWRDSYRQGTEAITDGQWSVAARFLREAISERPEEKVGAFRRYLPHYYLGIALAGENDCRGALAAWAESERQGEIRDARDESGDLRRRKAACSERLQVLETAASEAEQAIARARKAADIVDQLSRSAQLATIWSQGNPSLESRRRAADRQLIDAEQKLRRGEDQADPAVIREARAVAVRAASDFDAVARDARGRVGELSNATASAIDQLEEVETTARRTLGEIAELEPYPPLLGRSVEALQQDLDVVTDTKGRARADELLALKERLTTALNRLRRAAAGPPRELLEAAEAYFRGDLEGTVEKLTDRRFRDPRAVRHACLLLAASRHALWVLGGEQDAELVARAADDVATCAALDPPPEIPERFFSPRFLRFYRATVEALAASAPAAESEEETPAER